MKNILLTITMVLLLLTIGFSHTYTRNGVEFTSIEFATPTNYATAIVTRHTDGDTFRVILNGKEETLRLAGVDTPEVCAPGKPVEFYGPQASQFTKLACQIGDQVYLTFEDKERGYFGRLLVYVWYKTDSGTWQLHNYVLVRNGYSPYYGKYKFDSYYMDLFKVAADLAKLEGLGVHTPNAAVTITIKIGEKE